jgi:hypothetical protein
LVLSSFLCNAEKRERENVTDQNYQKPHLLRLTISEKNEKKGKKEEKKKKNSSPTLLHIE